MVYSITYNRLVSNGGVVGTEWERDGNGVGVGTGTPFQDKPPPPPPLPRLSRKGALRAGSSINAPLRDNRGGLSRKGVLSRLVYQLFLMQFYAVSVCKKKEIKREIASVSLLLGVFVQENDVFLYFSDEMGENI